MKTNGNSSTLLNHNKRQFIEAVKLMAPGNKFIADVARRVPQDMLPAVAGVAAFELASTLEMLCKSWRLRRPLEAARPSFPSRNFAPPGLPGRLAAAKSDEGGSLRRRAPRITGRELY